MDRRQKNVIILILSGLAALAPFSIDMYLPAFPTIAKEMGVDIPVIGFSLTGYFIGISIGQLIYGPITDRFGRRKPLLFGLVVYAIAALGCSLATSAEWLIVMRILSALGGCVGMVVTRAIVRDLFPVNETAQVFSTMMLVMGVAPIIAPTVGSFIFTHFGWRVIFYFLMVWSTLMILAVIFFLKESKEADPLISLKPLAVVREYRDVITVTQFLLYTLSGSLFLAGMFAYISGSPFVFMKHFGYTESQYGWIFGFNAGGLILGSQINRLLLKKYNSSQIILYAGSTFFVLVIFMVLSYVFGFVVKEVVLPSVFTYMFLLGILNPNVSALALEPFTRFAGSASALIGAFQMAIGAFISAAVGFFHNGTPLPMIAAMSFCATGGFACLLYYRYTLNKKHLQEAAISI
jgi:DHA1 family bicyclomycin/chloramphenicol resistance-like MFS transporter